MPTECNPDLFGFAAVGRREVVGSFDGGSITSDAGALLLRQTDQVIGLSKRLAACFHDRCCQELVEHSVETLVGQRVFFGIALGYEDINDHDELRHDPTMAVLAGKPEAGRVPPPHGHFASSGDGEAKPDSFQDRGDGRELWIAVR